jgi:hypothetical protein
VIRYPANSEGLSEQGTPLFFDEQRFNPVFRIGTGDLDDNGLLDVVYARKQGGVHILLQVPEGGFYLETSPELAEQMATPFDIKLHDLDGDGRDDVLIMLADREKVPGDERQKAPGGVRAFLSKERP